MSRAKTFDRAGWLAWQSRRYDEAMRFWAVYLRVLDTDRRAWYGIYDR